MALRLEVDGEDFESGNEIFEGEKIRGNAEYRYCGFGRGLGLAWLVDRAIDEGQGREKAGR